MKWCSDYRPSSTKLLVAAARQKRLRNDFAFEDAGQRTLRRVKKGEYMKTVSFEALDEKVLLSDNSRKRLSSFWQERLVALVFLRHFG